MAKTPKISYKTYYNERLKEVTFHDKQTYPLYIQVTYSGNNTQFRSYYFKLFSGEQYSIPMGFATFGPKLEDVEKLEINLIEFIIDKLGDEFSLEEMRATYSVYCRDLCDAMEDSFRDYLFHFMWDEGMQDFGAALKEGCKYRFPYRVVTDMKRVLKPDMYDKLINNALYHSAPYLPVFGYMETKKKWPALCLSIKDWESDGTKEKFADYVKKNYKVEDVSGILEDVEGYVSAIKDGKI